MDLPRSRTLSVRHDEVIRLRLSKGWTVRQLASRAVCSEKTIQNIERGEKVYLATLVKVAKALGVEATTLLTEPVNATPAYPILPPAEPRISITIRLDIPITAFDECKVLPEFVERLTTIAGWGNGIHVVSVTNGSTDITIEIDESQLKAIVAAFFEGGLHYYRVTEIRLEGPDAMKKYAEMINAQRTGLPLRTQSGDYYFKIIRRRGGGISLACYREPDLYARRSFERPSGTRSGSSGAAAMAEPEQIIVSEPPRESGGMFRRVFDAIRRLFTR